MEIAEIIASDAQRNGKRPADVLTGVMIALDKRKAKLFHDQKTLAIIEPIGKKDNEFQIHLFTADAPGGLLKSAKVLFQQVSSIPGIQKLYSNFENDKIKKLLEMIGVDLMESDRKDFNWMTEL